MCLVIAVPALAAAWMWWRPSLTKRAASLAAENRRTDAAALYEEHLRAHPEDQAARLALGDLWKVADPDRACAAYDAVPKGTPERLTALRRIVEVALSKGNDQRAEASLQELEQAQPEDYAVQLALTELHRRQGAPRLALAHAQKCAALRPDMIQNWLLIAEIQDDRRRPHEMITPLRRALELDPELVEGHLNLCYALVSAGDLPAARREARWCLERNADSVAARRLLALCEEREGSSDQALIEIRRALEVAPEDYECRLVEGQLLLFLRQPDRAYRRLQPLLGGHEDDRRLLTALSRAAAASDRKDEAADFLKRMERLRSPAPVPADDE